MPAPPHNAALARGNVLYPLGLLGRAQVSTVLPRRRGSQHPLTARDYHLGVEKYARDPGLHRRSHGHRCIACVRISYRSCVDWGNPRPPTGNIKTRVNKDPSMQQDGSLPLFGGLARLGRGLNRGRCCAGRGGLCPIHDLFDHGLPIHDLFDHGLEASCDSRLVLCQEIEACCCASRGGCRRASRGDRSCCGRECCQSSS